MKNFIKINLIIKECPEDFAKTGNCPEDLKV
jgi:hypothetical protein